MSEKFGLVEKAILVGSIAVVWRGIQMMHDLRVNLKGLGHTEFYNQLVTTYSKWLIDAIISHGTDLIWALGFPMLMATLSVLTLPKLTNETPERAVVQGAILGSVVAGMLGVMTEIRELTVPQLIKTCTEIGTSCGDKGDLAVFFIPLIAAAGYGVVQLIRNSKVKSQI